jgi:hypothetical protein
MRTVTATRYVTPLREGGSLPGLVEADDDGLYVVKFRGAGQGPRALVAELVAGELARAIKLPVPEVVLVDLDPRIATAEPDPEIQDLLKASEGLNVGLDFLPGALPYNPRERIDAELAAEIVWLDALIVNVDRTPRNPNLLRWHDQLWLIDHGAAFYRHHQADEHAWDVTGAARKPFPQIAEHVLLGDAGSLQQAGERIAARIEPATLDELAASVPRQWGDTGPYVEFLRARLERREELSAELEEARDASR